MSFYCKTFNVDPLPLSYFPQLIIVRALRGLMKQYKEGRDTFVDDITVTVMYFAM